MEERCSEQMSGWLYRLINQSRGYQKRWFVISNGMLSCYRRQEELGYSCRGTVILAGAFIDIRDSCHFLITNGPSQVFHLRASNKVERDRWVAALKLVQKKAIETDDSDEGGTEDNEHDQPLVNLKDKLRELTETHDLLYQMASQCGEDLSAMKDTDYSSREAKERLSEKISMFKLATGAMVKNIVELDTVARSIDHWYHHVVDQSSLRANNVTSDPLDHSDHVTQQLAGNISNGGFTVETVSAASSEITPSNELLPGQPLEPSSTDISLKECDVESVSSLPEATLELTNGSMATVVTDNEESDSEFFDALDKSIKISPPITMTTEMLIVTEKESVTSKVLPPLKVQLPSDKEDVIQLIASNNQQHINNTWVATDNFLASCEPTIMKRRETIIPKPNVRLNLWSFMKNSIGKDLSRIPLPVNFNEPLSFLQRLNEDLIYHDVLNKAVKIKSSCEQICYVAAFASSSYASTVYRTGKPFNPLLGETYECDRRCEMGWRSLTEQVSHHPPGCSQHVEHKDWTFWQDYTMGSKFRGKYLQIIPYGTAHLVFHNTGDHYTWSKVLTYIHNIIIGKLWIDQSGDLEVTNHNTGDKCIVKFIPYSYFSRERMRKISGKVTDKRGRLRYTLKGYWDEKIEYCEVLGDSEKDLKTGPAKLVWQAVAATPGSEHMYGFSDFTCTLNEPETGVCPTDSRLRPDQRIMENGDYDNANNEKVRLEEKQRAKRRKREAAAAKAAEVAAQGKHEEAKQLEEESSYSPFWFHKQFDPCTNAMAYKYKGGYWEAKSKGNFHGVPDIF